VSFQGIVPESALTRVKELFVSIDSVNEEAERLPAVDISQVT